MVGRSNDYVGTFSGSSLTVSDGITPPYHGDARVSIGANLVFGLRLHSEQSNALLASSRNGQTGKFLQSDWEAETVSTPVVRVARGAGMAGVNHSPLLTLETTLSDWSDRDALLYKRDGVDTFRLTVEGVVHSAGLVLPQMAEIPTNAVPAGSETVTNWMLVNLGGVPTFIATNHAEGGWLQKALWP